MALAKRKYKVRIGDKVYDVKVYEISPEKFKVEVNGREIEVMVISETTKPSITQSVSIPTTTTTIASSKTSAPSTSVIKPEFKPRVELSKPSRPTPLEEMNVIKAPVPGKVLNVYVKPGDKVTVKTVVLTFESMKMVLELYSPRDGIVKEVRVKPGDSFNAGDILIVLE